ncbi:hypothetical protein [Methanospirillum sp.]|uniref:hypothetical protein n=1 Tax=Methanospirillum sp. TaxID=45200 RepID=UPI002D1FC077|nr:hypothetical protein [Methanospirillum sp.]
MSYLPCPFTIGKTIKYCDNGNINGIRCPYWQQDGKYVYVEELLTNPVILNSELCKFIPNIMRDFEVVGNYRWYCTQWPGIREKRIECILQDSAGKKYSVNDVLKLYIRDGTGNQKDKELYHDGVERREQAGYHAYH